MPLLKKQHRFPALIFSSLALLAVFQALWLQKVWREQREDLQQETDFIFQKTVMALQDSLVRRSMVENHVNPDSFPSPRVPRLRRPVSPEQLQSGTQLQLRQDKLTTISLKARSGEFRPDSVGIEKVQIFVMAGDSNHEGGPQVERLISHIPVPRPGERRPFIFNIGRDTVPRDTLQAAYRAALLKENIPLDFSLVEANDSPFVWQNCLRTTPAFAGILTERFYTAEFADYRTYLLGQMLPHILFSLLLFGITAAAFGLIYRSLRQQQRLTALKNDFIANISHELKTPITTVGVALEALSDFEVLKQPEKAREYLSISQLELERLTLLVDKVLRLSVFEEKQPRLQPEPLDLAALVRQVLNALKLQADSARAEILLDISDDLPRINGDRLHLTSVVFNLLDNALKYRQAEAPVIRVGLSCLRSSLQSSLQDDNMVRLTVQDNGIGIPPEYQSKVFEKFFRVPSGNVHSVKGHGLGLSYVAGVVRQHGGSIRVESRVGEGSTFTVELPGMHG